MIVLILLILFFQAYSLFLLHRGLTHLQHGQRQLDKTLSRLLEEGMYQNDALDEICSKLGVRRVPAAPPQEAPRDH